MTSLVVRAHAKINLDLRIVGRRDDGYHDLRTMFQSLALHDRLVFRRRRGAVRDRERTPPTCRRTPATWCGVRRRRCGPPAAAAGEVRGVSVTIDKRIPSQAGLGGGSSDAAATLVALNELWRARFDAGDLARLGATLGADVPYFLVGGTALGLGRGEMLYPLPDVPSMGVLVVKPVVRRVDGGRVPLVRGGAAGSRATNVQALAVPWYPGPLVDRERPRGAGDAPPPGAARHPPCAAAQAGPRWR